MKSKIEDLKLEKRRHNINDNVNIFEKIKLKRNVPIQKIIGFIEMAGVKINVSKRILIPRYETEELIFHVINEIRKNQYKNILDLGCGSGFIGIAIKKNISNINVVQSDIDKNAIKQTIKNQKINGVENLVVHSDMFSNINDKFDLIVSNPPYLLLEEKENMSKSVLKYEPHHALFAKDNGLYYYKIIENNLNSFLNKNGMIFLEINPLNEEWFIKNKYQLIHDINGKLRFAFKMINH